MNSRKLHKIIGLLLFVPLIGWSLTGMVFLVKPGYEGAYERIYPKTYPIEETFKIESGGNWHEARILRTILGYHLLVKQDGSWKHLDLKTLKEKPISSETDLFALVEDAISTNKDRYGNIASITSGKIFTDTGVEIAVDWSKLSISQAGSDTHFLNALYKVHYLQWSGLPALNVALGATGIVLLLTLVIFGFSLYRRTPVKGT